MCASSNTQSDLCKPTKVRIKASRRTLSQTARVSGLPSLWLSDRPFCVGVQDKAKQEIASDYHTNSAFGGRCMLGSEFRETYGCLLGCDVIRVRPPALPPTAPSQGQGLARLGSWTLMASRRNSHWPARGSNPRAEMVSSALA